MKQRLSGTDVSASDDIRELDYPHGDGVFVAESDCHRNQCMYLIEVLKQWFSVQRVYVSGVVPHQFEVRGSRQCIYPDVLVAFGHPSAYDVKPPVWSESVAPDLIVEVTSAANWKDDFGRKMSVYAHIGVKETWVVDPFEECLGRPLAGYRLKAGEWAEMAVEDDRAYSEVLGLDFVAGPEQVWLANPARDLLQGVRELLQVPSVARIELP